LISSFHWMTKQPTLEFLGFRVDKDGIKPTCEKVEAIQKAPPPRNKTELQAFLGLLNFYSCFLPNKATVLEPLHRLLDQSATWQWGAKHETAYVQKPLAVVCDASHYGLGALLFHLERDGQEKPICFASRTMTTTERNYAQIDKEALWIPGVIIDVTGPLSYKVRTSDGQMHRRHVDQLRDRVAPSIGPSRPEPDGYTVSLPEPSEAEMPELQLPAIEMENPGEEIAGAETMSRVPPF
uniref:Reverse transcriptase/retrotransposon-derived protein RNase H-like domain-containing protein n=1 Tax=Sinocyclocheilus anshuiensis TaxID=1608454 RepID=A0A671QI48_9TELE